MKNSNPLVSVVIIFLNEERFLREAIESVFAQTSDDWELLLVDDGSTDGSSEIARGYAERSPWKVRYLIHEGHRNRGMSASRNLGIRNACGKYISYLDGDDVWLPNKLEEQVAILESHREAAMVYGPLQRWFSWNGNPSDLHREHLVGAGRKGVHPHWDTLVTPPAVVTLFLPDEYFIPGGILIRREAIDSVGLYDEAFRGMYEDTVMMTKICLEFPVFVSGNVWYKYRMHPDACTFVSWRNGESDSAFLTYLHWVEKYLTEKGIRDARVWGALQKAQWRCRHANLYRLRDLQYLKWWAKKMVKSMARRSLPETSRRWIKVQLNR
ncbi:MAG: glycosyl transferase family 2 [Deltaproteobacteria bacterium]|nr:glycosyl transferase family 2 [Deltaproteobacteria bacterium]